MTQGQRLSWKSLEPFGVEVEGDLRHLSAEDRAELRRRLFAHGLIVAKRQTLSLPDQQAIAAYVGPVLTGGRGMEYVKTDDGILGDKNLAYHSDLSFAPEPFTAISLYGLDVAEGRTSTLFASAVRAYATAPDALKARLAGLKAISVNPSHPDGKPVGYDFAPDIIRQTRDIILTHPVTGERYIYVNEQHAARIEGWGREESDALLKEIFALLYAPENVYEHVWMNGDLVFWDNLALQHGRPDQAGVFPRVLQRAAVAEKSMMEQMPEYQLQRIPATM
jgi:taurine dioxygenase